MAVTDAGGFTSFYARYPQLCVGACSSATSLGDDVTTGARSGGCGQGFAGEQLVTPSDNALVGHFNDQVIK